MAKKKAAAKETAAEVIEILEEDLSSAEETGRAWSEELGDAGNEVKRFAKNLWKEGTTRRVVVRNEAGDTVVNLPVAMGALALFPPLTAPILGISVVGSVVALATKCKISMEKNDSVDTPAEAA